MARDDGRTGAASAVEGGPSQGGESLASLIEKHQQTLERLASFRGAPQADVERIIVEAWEEAAASGAATAAVRDAVFRSVIVNVHELERELGEPDLLDPEKVRAVEASRLEDRNSPFADYFLKMPVSFAGLGDEQAAAGARAAAEEALAAVPFAERVVVALRDVGGWSAGEVVELLEIDPVRQRVLLHAGRVRVRRALERLVEAEVDDG